MPLRLSKAAPPPSYHCIRRDLATASTAKRLFYTLLQRFWQPLLAICARLARLRLQSLGVGVEATANKNDEIIAATFLAAHASDLRRLAGLRLQSLGVGAEATANKNDDIRRLIEILLKVRKKNLVLVGEKGARTCNKITCA